MGAPSITVAELDEHIKKIGDKELEIAAQKEVLTGLNKELATLEMRCVDYLKDLGRDEYDGPSGKVSISQKWTVNLPADDVEKKKFRVYLEELDIFDGYWSVHAARLNAYYKREWEIAKEKGEGLTFSLPGIGPPQLFEDLKFKAVKNEPTRKQCGS